MEHVATTLGLSLPVTTAKQCVMRRARWQMSQSSLESNEAVDSCEAADDCPPIPPSIVFDISSSPRIGSKVSVSVSPLRTSNKASRIVGGSWFNKSSRSQDDEDAATLDTCNSSEDETSFSCSSSSTVSFAEPLVAQVYYRPIVATLEEKHALFYNERDYLSFRQDYLQKRQAAKRRQQQQRAEPRVKFAQDVVTQVHCYPNPCLQEENALPKDALFYSEADLQRFLDDFVASLNGAMPSSTAQRAQS